MKENLTAVYCRLSKEDLDKDMGKTLSESIKNQKSMLEAYALERQWNIYDFYIDEDYSGSDRNRPEFNRLIADSLLGRFNIVLCKKQARFARDIEYVEKYIHGLFTERQIRFVAVLDNIDTASSGRSVRKASQINSLVDEWYLSDLSESIISSLNTKRRNAEFIGSFTPYGYRKDPDNKNALLIDPEAAEIVKMIFGWYRSGWGLHKISQELNAGGIPNPLLYKQKKGEKINPNPQKLTETKYLWTPSTISAILHNQTYSGFLVQGKYKKASYKSKKLLRVPKSEWIVIPGCHEPIIDQETWDSVQSGLASKGRATGSGRIRNALAGKVFCGECGSRLVSSGGRSGRTGTTYLCCSKHKISKDACTGARIEYSMLEKLLLERIGALTKQYFDEEYLHNHWEWDRFPIDPGKSELASLLNAVQNRLSTLENQRNLLYYDRLEGIITREMYASYCGRLSEEKESLLQQQENLTEILSSLAAANDSPAELIRLLDGYRSPEKLLPEMANQLLESVRIFRRIKNQPQEIRITWSF